MSHTDVGDKNGDGFEMSVTKNCQCIQNYDMQSKLNANWTLIRITILDKHENFRFKNPFYSVRQTNWALMVCPLYITKMNNGFLVVIRMVNEGKWQKWMDVELKCYQTSFHLMEPWSLLMFTTSGKWFKSFERHKWIWGYIDFNDGCWRRNMLVTTIRKFETCHHHCLEVLILKKSRAKIRLVIGGSHFVRTI